MADVQPTPVRLGGEGAPRTTRPPIDVRVVGFDMPFSNLVGFFIKAALAAVPAAIIVAIIWAVVAVFLFGGLAGMAGRHV